MIIIYTGNGKGKTSASLGQAIRAHGAGLRVCFGQFMKQPNQAGEQTMCATLFGEGFMAGGLGFFYNENQRPRHREAALTMLGWAKAQFAKADLLVLDETLYALGSGLLTEAEVRELLALARETDTHLVLSGRGLPAWLAEEADLITQMEEIKHPCTKGQKALKGIEF